MHLFQTATAVLCFALLPLFYHRATNDVITEIPGFTMVFIYRNAVELAATLACHSNSQKHEKKG